MEFWDPLSQSVLCFAMRRTGVQRLGRNGSRPTLIHIYSITLWQAEVETVHSSVQNKMGAGFYSRLEYFKFYLKLTLFFPVIAESMRGKQLLVTDLEVE